MFTDFRTDFQSILSTKPTFQPTVLTLVEFDRTITGTDPSEIPQLLEAAASQFLSTAKAARVCKLLYCRGLFVSFGSSLAECVQIVGASLCASHRKGLTSRSISVETTKPIDSRLVEQLENDLSRVESFGSFQDQRSIRMLDGVVQGVVYIYIWDDEKAAHRFYEAKVACCLNVVAHVDPDEEKLPARISELENLQSYGLGRGVLLAFCERSNRVLNKWSLNDPNLIESIREFQSKNT